MKDKRIKHKIESTKSKPIPCTESHVFVTEYAMKKGKRSVTAKLVIILELKGNEWKETEYRVKENVRGKTCSRNYSVRLLL